MSDNKENHKRTNETKSAFVPSHIHKELEDLRNKYDKLILPANKDEDITYKQYAAAIKGYYSEKADGFKEGSRAWQDYKYFDNLGYLKMFVPLTKSEESLFSKRLVESSRKWGALKYEDGGNINDIDTKIEKYENDLKALQSKVNSALIPDAIRKKMQIAIENLEKKKAELIKQRDSDVSQKADENNKADKDKKEEGEGNKPSKKSNKEKIELLKKQLNNPAIPENLKPQLQATIDKLEGLEKSQGDKEEDEKADAVNKKVPQSSQVYPEEKEEKTEYEEDEDDIALMKEAMSGTVYHKNYKLLLKIIPDLVENIDKIKKACSDAEVIAKKATSEGFMPLSFETRYMRYDTRKKGCPVISLAHYYTQNGDLLSDPFMEIEVCVEEEWVQAIFFEQHGALTKYAEVFPEKGKVNTSEKKSQNRFLTTWFTNLYQQGFQLYIGDAPEQKDTGKDKIIEKPEQKKEDFVYFEEELANIGDSNSVNIDIDIDEISVQQIKIKDVKFYADYHSETKIDDDRRNLRKEYCNNFNDVIVDDFFDLDIIIKDIFKEYKKYYYDEELANGFTENRIKFNSPAYNEVKLIINLEIITNIVTGEKKDISLIFSFYKRTLAYNVEESTFLSYAEQEHNIRFIYVGDKTNEKILIKPDITQNFKNQYKLNKAIENLIDYNITFKQGVFTLDEMKFIEQYEGYGGLQQYIKKENTIEEGVLTEFFTPTELVKKMWGLAYQYGYDGKGKILENSVGVGRFLKYAPPSAEIDAYEINYYSYMICKILYPNVFVRNVPFESVFIDNNNKSVKNNVVPQYSLVIGNPPYGAFYSKYSALEKKHTKTSNLVEYFITRSLDLLVSGGLLVYVIGTVIENGGTPFLDSKTNACKKDIMKKAELVDAYRLGNNIFKGTSVLADIVIFRKK